MLTDILKKCLRGIIYILTLPILLIILAFYAIVGVIQFFFVGIKSIFYFFTGRNLFGEFPEDARAREILEGTGNTVINDTSINESPYITPINPTNEPDDNIIDDQKGERQ